MTVLLLRFAGPLQAWGDSSRFVYRTTRSEPTKSGVIGLLAAAQGRSRADDVSDLVGLRLGVRADQAGKLIKDFQTEIDWRNSKAKPLTYRHYLADAKFLVGIEGERELLEGLAESIKKPAYPLFLGRRSCTPTGKIVLGFKEDTLDDALDQHPWLAADWYRRKQPQSLRLPISTDCEVGDKPDELIRDIPISFGYENRKHALRPVRHRLSPPIPNPDGIPVRDHDPFALVGGAQ
ncbi:MULTISPECIES: type I-E CRISPR-associated protein Cas5/CasD [unclassified Corynebacterium]|uniref:type I-E CRISPR-associated protein Cas5/CasD n=1 Tax=unclassified Corynebacterium TaxID=2624378 RepID=UPI002168E8EE|nr:MULTISPECIES: type I-E CRISPR-associated protein Cas5/CasD [unclassified Corynebacterium]MCS4492463.1 type I-E CRISPR-associated protein Cas5/CasD [Corynebacterium sp. ES2715-CONJ3]MCS4532573.1 type I-E CRISPR-associated protein Cas5/CasD [Corynebacterium sp. ES2730-CONJ]